MSGMVEGWMGQLAKLREKVVTRKSFFSKAKDGSEEAVEKEAQKEMMAAQRETTGATMSEATMCLLMDRFVPC